MPPCSHAAGFRVHNSIMADTMTPEPREFPETHWSQLLEIQNPAHPRHAEHLQGLVQRYWKPAYLYLRAIRSMSAEDAEDLTQQFFAMLLARRAKNCCVRSSASSALIERMARR